MYNILPNIITGGKIDIRINTFGEVDVNASKCHLFSSPSYISSLLPPPNLKGKDSQVGVSVKLVVIWNMQGVVHKHIIKQKTPFISLVYWSQLENLYIAIRDSEIFLKIKYTYSMMLPLNTLRKISVY